MWVSWPPSSAYRVAGDGVQFRVAVRDNDGVEVELDAGFNTLVWPGLDGVSVAEALSSAGGDADVTDIVIAIYEWDEAAATWFSYVPAASGVPGVNTLETLHAGRLYLVRALQPVTWMVPRPSATGVDPSSPGCATDQASHPRRRPRRREGVSRRDLAPR